MRFKWKLYIVAFILFTLLAGTGYLYFRYFFTYEQRNVVQREVETIVGQNLSVTVFDYNGNILKRWTGVKKVTSSGADKNYVYFYTKENKYIQMPHSLWYIIEEE